VAQEGHREWSAEYRASLGAYEACAEKLERLLSDLLTTAGIDAVDVESRAKDPESLEQKVDAKRGRYEEPLKDVTDLIGVRVIAYYLEDVERISRIIEAQFEVDRENSSDKLQDLGSDRFGYRSVHFVITLAENRADLEEWAIFVGKRAEIQVRTATQHAWAAVEHKLSYKRTSEAPQEVRRKLMRLSALFELADEQFSSVRAELEKVGARYAHDVRGGNLDLPIDTSSLKAFLETSTRSRDLVARFQKLGLGVAALDNEEQHKRYEVDLRDLAVALDALDVKTLMELDEMLGRIILDDGRIEQMISAFEGVFTRWGSAADLLTVVLGVEENMPMEVFEKIYAEPMWPVVRELRGGTPDEGTSD